MYKHEFSSYWEVAAEPSGPPISVESQPEAFERSVALETWSITRFSEIM